jgi:hypothetical protein
VLRPQVVEVVVIVPPARTATSSTASKILEMDTPISVALWTQLVRGAPGEGKQLEIARESKK